MRVGGPQRAGEIAQGSKAMAVARTIFIAFYDTVAALPPWPRDLWLFDEKALC